LLFESLESLILLMKKDASEAELLVDHFSAVYRYILSKTKRELIPIDKELLIVKELLLLFEHLPYRKTKYKTTTPLETCVVPGSVLLCIEQIIRSTIVSQDVELAIEIFEEGNSLSLKYIHQDKITQTLNESDLKYINDTYRFYTTQKITLTKDDTNSLIKIPKLTLNESSNY